MKLKKVLAPAALLIALLMTAQALAGSEFLFNGYATYTPAPDQLGATMDVYGILSTVGGVPTPIAVDMDNYQYTVHVEGMTIGGQSSYPPPPFPRMSSIFNGGMVHIYSDPIAGGTAADYGDVSTFVDGELILFASVDDGWTLNLMDGSITPPGVFTGSGAGTCDFIGGTRVGDLSLAEYFLNDWNFLGLDISDPNPPVTPVPDGFDRSFKTKLTPPNDPTASENSTWGKIKDLYH